MQPNSEVARYWRIWSSQRLGADALAEAEQVNPNSPTIHVLLGEVYRQRQQDDQAIAEYQKTIALSPEDPGALLGLAVAYMMEAKLDNATENAQAALDQKPYDPEINLLMADLPVARRDYSHAEPFLAKSRNVASELQPRVHALLGQVYAASDRVLQAIDEMRQSLSTDDDGSIYYQLARLYQKTGEKTLAVQAMQQAKDLQEKRHENATMALKNAASEWKVKDGLR